MQRLPGTRMNSRWTGLISVVAGIGMSGCAGEIPSSPSASAGESPGLHATDHTAAARFPISVDPRGVRLRCNAGFPCNIQVLVTSSSTVSLSYFIEGDFTRISEQSNCGGVLFGTCIIHVAVTSTELPGRRSGRLVLEDATGATKTVRLSATVS